MTCQKHKYGTLIPTYFKRPYQIGDLVCKTNSKNQKRLYLLLDYDISSAKDYGYYRIAFLALDIENFTKLSLFVNTATVPLLEQNDKNPTASF